MGFWAALPQIIGTASSLANKPKQNVQPVAMISSQKPTQPVMPEIAPPAMGIGAMLNTGSNIMGAIDRRKEAVNANPQDTLKQGLQAIDTYKSDDINTEFIRNKLYEAYQKSQTMG